MFSYVSIYIRLLTMFRRDILWNIYIYLYIKFLLVRLKAIRFVLYHRYFDTVTGTSKSSKSRVKVLQVCKAIKDVNPGMGVARPPTFWVGGRTSEYPTPSPLFDERMVFLRFNLSYRTKIYSHSN